jgi:hypothetical protein
MKKLILTVAVLGLIIPGNAKNYGEGKGKGFSADKAAERKVQRLSDSIEMTETQKNSMKGVFEKFYTEIHEIRKAEIHDKAEMKKAKEIRDAEVKKILNDDTKFSKYESMTSRKHRNGEAMGNGKKKGHYKGKHGDKKDNKKCENKEDKKRGHGEKPSGNDS